MHVTNPDLSLSVPRNFLKRNQYKHQGLFLVKDKQSPLPLKMSHLRFFVQIRHFDKWKLYSSSKVIKYVLIKTNFHFLLPKEEVCFDQYELVYLGRIKFLHVEMPYLWN